MPVSNAQIADVFERYAALLELDGANAFRVRAYRNAARTLHGWPTPVAALLADGADLSELPGIGDDLADKIRTVVQTGELPQLDALSHKIPAGLAELERLPGLGPKRVKTLYQILHVDSLAALRRAAEAHRIRDLPRFGAKLEAKILAALVRDQQAAKRMLLVDAEQAAAPLLDYLKALPTVARITIAGSYRRRRATVGDLDILATSGEPARVMAAFIAYAEVDEVISHGDTRATVRLRGGLQVDLRVVPAASYGAALHYFTGSKAHNIGVRTLAIEQGFKLNEYGLYRGERRVAGDEERDVYRALGLAYIEPELREDRGEIQAARERTLPNLVTLDDMRGDLHAHTVATDGRNTAEEMARAARALGYDYIAISDHTRHVTIANGMDARRYAAHLDALEQLQERLSGIRLLKSAEVDILEDGSLDLPDTILQRLDFTVCAVHYAFDLSARRQTERIIRAMDHPRFNILAHPTGRLLGKREAYALERERLMQAARERGCILEINAQPARLDLSEEDARAAKAMGVKLVISTDAHSTAGLQLMRFGIDQARRAWLEAGDVLNTLSWRRLKKALARA